jgi:hypothetical protein
MKKLLTLTTVALLFSGCASKPPPPEWQSQAHAALTHYTGAYLSGNNRVADLEFERARAEIARTGRPDLMARIELLRCATQVASLVLTPCAAYHALAGDAPLAEQAYAGFISGKWTGLDTTRLPQPYQELVRQSQVAVGSLIQREPLTSTDIDLAVETASSQGWRRPLLAWLNVQLKHKQAAGAADAAAGIQRRIDLMLQKN